MSDGHKLCQMSIVYVALSPTDSESTFLLIRSSSRQLSSESILLRRRGSRWEPSSPTSALYYSSIFSSLFIHLCLQIGTKSSILFLAIPIRDSMPLLQYFRQLVSVSRDVICALSCRDPSGPWGVEKSLSLYGRLRLAGMCIDFVCDKVVYCYFQQLMWW